MSGFNRWIGGKKWIWTVTILEREWRGDKRLGSDVAGPALNSRHSVLQIGDTFTIPVPLGPLYFGFVVLATQNTEIPL